MTGARTPGGKRRLPSLSTAILIGFLAGVACGLLFGEHCGVFDVVGDAYIRLLQMAVLPYIAVTLVASLGRLSPESVRSIAGRLGLVLAAIWIVALVLVFLLGFAFPPFETASFFSTSTVQPPPGANLLELYIPANPFRSLADNVVPAVVLFGIAVGVALIRIREKDRLIAPLQVLSDALIQVTGFVIMLTPVGIFAIAASGAGTITTEEFGRIQGFLLTGVAGTLILVFWILPLGVSALTPFTYRGVLRHTKDALVIAFTTGNLFVTLPMLAESGQRLFEERGFDREKSSGTVDVVLPITYAFPTSGKLLLLVFVPFAAWFVGEPLDFVGFLDLATSGFLTFFGATPAAVPYLLDQHRIPADTFEFFMVTSVIAFRLAAAGAVMHLFATALLVTSLRLGAARLRLGRMALALGGGAGLTCVAVIGIRVYLSAVGVGEYHKDRVVAEAQLLRETARVTVHGGPPTESDAHAAGRTRLEHIRRRGSLRVGYVPDRLPFAFTNKKGQLVGLDVELIHRLSKELALAVEFFPVTFDEAERSLRTDAVDLVISGIPTTTDTLASARMTVPYLDVTMSFVVRDHERGLYATGEKVRAREKIRLGVVTRGYFADRVRERLPNVEPVLLKSYRDFFEGRAGELDALLISAEAGSAWTLLYPQFSVVVPQPSQVSVPLAIGVPAHDERFADFVSRWIDVKRKDRTIRELVDHWVFGKTAQERKRRWCVLRDVLGWID